MPAGTQVAVVVGKQQTTVPVPDVVGKDADDAKDELENAGFTVKTAKAPGGDEGKVASTNPAGGSQVPPKSTITMNVSNGEDGEITMPDVEGALIDEAEATLQSEGIEMSSESLNRRRSPLRSDG